MTLFQIRTLLSLITSVETKMKNVKRNSIKTSAETSKSTNTTDEYLKTAQISVKYGTKNL